MKKYIRKYAILLIILIGLESLIKFGVLVQLQTVLMEMGVEFNEAKYWVNTILINLPYLTNLVLALLILRDLIKNEIKAIPVVLLTVVSHFAGVIFFLFLMNNKIKSHE